MGRRNRKTRFMPDVYVFPGGRVDPADARASGFAEDLPGAPRGLDRATRGRLAAFARAALRETFEETGLLVAREALGTTQSDSRPDSPRPVPDPWQAYRQARLSPAFDALHLTARAITPTDSPIRFHTRFFRADGAATASWSISTGSRSPRSTGCPWSTLPRWCCARPWRSAARPKNPRRRCSAGRGAPERRSAAPERGGKPGESALGPIRRRRLDLIRAATIFRAP